jgi:Arm DNA-binding domain
MPKIELVRESQVKALPAPDPSGKPTYFAEDLPGFAVLVSGVAATKTYIAQRDLPGGRSRRVKIGRCNLMPLKKARIEASDMLLRIEKGAARKAQARGATTLRQLLTDYLEGNPNLRPTSARNYRRHGWIFRLGGSTGRRSRSVIAPSRPKSSAGTADPPVAHTPRALEFRRGSSGKI